MNPTHRNLAICTSTRIFLWEKVPTTKATIVVGSWSIHAIPLQRDVIVRSLLWPGYFMYYSDTGKDYGSGYFGMGEKNKDIAFCVP
jgi:hypothetical protein